MNPISSTKAVIMAGGKGTRINSAALGVPKPLIDICGKPVLERQIECLVRQGICDITIVIGFMGDSIKNFFGDGDSLGAKLSYFSEPSPLGTAGALYLLCGEWTDSFFVINGDLVFDFCAEKMLRFHHDKNALATVLAHPNSHPYDSALLETDSTSRVTAWLGKERDALYCRNLLNSGIHLLSPELFKTGIGKQRVNLDRDVLIPALSSGRVFAYESAEYVRDMGTPERLDAVRSDVSRGLVEMRSLSQKRRAVFLDRDGTINVYKGYISRPCDIELLPGAADAVRAINDSGYLAVVATNQALIARGECTEKELRVINNALETLLGAQGAYIDALYYCPHHPDKGFPGEVPSLKIDCECRKPKPAMLLRAAGELNLDLHECFMVGDSISDVRCGLAAGCKSVYLRCGKQQDEIPQDVPIYDDLLDFVKGSNLLNV